MKADPRGVVELSEAIGREAAVERLWSTLTSQGVVLQGRSGLGKTTLVRLAFASPPKTWAGRLVSLPPSEREGTRGLARALLVALSEAAEPGPSLRALIEPRLRGRDGLSRRSAGEGPSRRSAGEDGPAQILVEPSDDTLGLIRNAILAELADRSSSSGSNLVIAIDDFDRFLDDHHDRGGELAELLATLDALRREQPRLRWLLVSNTRLARSLERMRPRPPSALLDALERVLVEPLSPESGARLAVALLLGESVTARDRAAFARRVAETFDHVPKWIHAALAELSRRRGPVSESDLEPLLGRVTSDPRDPWQLRAELNPVLRSYSEPTRGIALAVLDLLALAEEDALTFTQLRQRLAIEMTLDADAIRRVVDELRQDQICEELGGRLRFCGELLRHAWIHARGLAPARPG